jgi:hypothetical protein
MSNHSVRDTDTESIYLAGELAPAGLYQRIGSTHTVRLIVQDYLPATLDGRVACYARVHSLWSDQSESGRQESGKTHALAA